MHSQGPSDPKRSPRDHQTLKQQAQSILMQSKLMHCGVLAEAQYLTC